MNARVEKRLSDVRAAVDGLRAASRSDADERRERVADWLDGLFADVTDPAGLREGAREALMLYRGGMGSFHDVGDAVMHRAVGDLYRALTAAARRW